MKRRPSGAFLLSGIWRLSPLPAEFVYPCLNFSAVYSPPTFPFGPLSPLVSTILMPLVDAESHCERADAAPRVQR